VITLITGLPGNGKTLYALWWLKQQAEKDGRTVYFSGINDCKVPGWIEHEPERWMELPANSVILIDEVQRVMRPRQHGSTVPPFVAALETHRHKGVDLVLITQHPMLLDSNVRRLVGQHFHCVRKFGSHFSTIHEWNAVKESCDKNREDSIRHEWRFPKEAFALYKSAEVHTHKRRIPMKVKLLLALPFIIGGIVYAAWNRLDPHKEKAPLKNAFTGETAAAGAAGGATAKPGKLTTAEYLKEQAPRVPGLAYTAPVYDSITQPTEAPYPAACLSMGTRCECYSQQATKLDVPIDLCNTIAKGGFFLAWKQTPRGERPSEVMPTKSQQPIEAAPQVVSIGTGAGFARSPQDGIGGGTARSVGDAVPQDQGAPRGTGPGHRNPASLPG
jgi:zona occludens toxin